MSNVEEKLKQSCPELSIFLEDQNRQIFLGLITITSSIFPELRESIFLKS